MTSPHRHYDLCCCAGLGSDGWAAVLGARAIRGYDIDPQPHYPYDFHQADVMPLLADPGSELNEATSLSVSFPCQFFTTAAHLRTTQGGVSRYTDLLTPGLALLREHWAHKPWVVENVEDNQGKVRAIMEPRAGEHLIVLCGSMFGLEVQRHRLFLANYPLRQPPAVPGPGKHRAQGCDHSTFPIDPNSGRPRPWGVYHVKGDNIPSGGRTARDEEHGRHVMGSRRLLPWDKLKEGFHPAFTSWVAADLIAHLTRTATA